MLSEILTFEVPLSQAFLHQAKKFSQKQKDQEKARQVYLNTLAVLAVNYYCKCLEIETNLQASDSWNKGIRTLLNVADLEIVGVGKLECRPVLGSVKVCHIPPEVWENRIGYVVVKIDEESREATLLGFIQKVEAEEISINRLDSLEDLLYALEEQQITVLPANPISEAKQGIVQLSQWLQNIFEELWQPPELILAGAYRGGGITTEKNKRKSSISRATLLNLVGESNQAVVLVVKITPKEDGEFDILLRVYPGNSSLYLPQELTLKVLDDSGEEISDLQVQAGIQDNWIQQEFECELGDKFSIQIVYNEIKFTENFIM